MGKNESYIAVPGLKSGMISAAELKRTAELMEKYEVKTAKVTGGQRIAFLGMDKNKLNQFKEELCIPDGPPHARNKLHNVQTCPGAAWCKFGVQDTLPMRDKLLEFTFEAPLPHKVKVGIAGCPMSCTESWVRDIGVIGTKKGWKVTFAGNAGAKPRIGDLIAENLSDYEAVECIQKLLAYYTENCTSKLRSARFVEKVGIEAVKQGIEKS